jgi:hypothetical protein
LITFFEFEETTQGRCREGDEGHVIEQAVLVGTYQRVSKAGKCAIAYFVCLGLRDDRKVSEQGDGFAGESNGALTELLDFKDHETPGKRIQSCRRIPSGFLLRTGVFLCNIQLRAESSCHSNEVCSAT